MEEIRKEIYRIFKEVFSMANHRWIKIVNLVNESFCKVLLLLIMSEIQVCYVVLLKEQDSRTHYLNFTDTSFFKETVLHFIHTHEHKIAVRLNSPSNPNESLNMSLEDKQVTLFIPEPTEQLIKSSSWEVVSGVQDNFQISIVNYLKAIKELEENNKAIVLQTETAQREKMEMMIQTENQIQIYIENLKQKDEFIKKLKDELNSTLEKIKELSFFKTHFKQDVLEGWVHKDVYHLKQMKIKMEYQEQQFAEKVEDSFKTIKDFHLSILNLLTMLSSSLENQLVSRRAICSSFNELYDEITILCERYNTNFFQDEWDMIEESSSEKIRQQPSWAVEQIKFKENFKEMATKLNKLSYEIVRSSNGLIYSYLKQEIMSKFLEKYLSDINKIFFNKQEFILEVTNAIKNFNNLSMNNILEERDFKQNFNKYLEFQNKDHFKSILCPKEKEHSEFYISKSEKEDDLSKPNLSNQLYELLKNNEDLTLQLKKYKELLIVTQNEMQEDIKRIKNDRQKSEQSLTHQRNKEIANLIVKYETEIQDNENKFKKQFDSEIVKLKQTNDSLQQENIRLLSLLSSEKAERELSKINEEKVRNDYEEQLGRIKQEMCDIQKEYTQFSLDHQDCHLRTKVPIEPTIISYNNSNIKQIQEESTLKVCCFLLYLSQVFILQNWEEKIKNRENLLLEKILESCQEEFLLIQNVEYYKNMASSFEGENTQLKQHNQQLLIDSEYNNEVKTSQSLIEYQPFVENTEKDKQILLQDINKECVLLKDRINNQITVLNTIIKEGLLTNVEPANLESFQISQANLILQNEISLYQMKMKDMEMKLEFNQQSKYETSYEFVILKQNNDLLNQQVVDLKEKIEQLTKNNEQKTLEIKRLKQQNKQDREDKQFNQYSRTDFGNSMDKNVVSIIKKPDLQSSNKGLDKSTSRNEQEMIAKLRAEEIGMSLYKEFLEVLRENFEECNTIPNIPKINDQYTLYNTYPELRVYFDYLNKYDNIGYISSYCHNKKFCSNVISTIKNVFAVGKHY